jgi:23S rRNA pseudouridine2605 synthase
MMERLQKVIAQAGVCSRRKAEELIAQGRVSVNGKIILQLGTKVDASQDHLKVDGRRLRFGSSKIYLLLNKPRGYLCTLSDPQGRPKVTDLIHGISQKIFPVGRLDYASEGLLLLTNDGEFANIIASAGEHCPKVYLTKVRGNPTLDELREISHGLVLDGQPIAPCQIQYLKQGDNPWFSVTLTEGKQNQIRKMFERINHPVVKLRRVQIGFLSDPHLKPGDYRHLTPGEVSRFRRLQK